MSSNIIDNRVVSLGFDNTRFESNVKQSMSTLDKLKSKLNFGSSTKSFEEINSASEKVNFSGLSSGVTALQAKFSAMQVVAMTAISNITNTAMRAGHQIVNAMTLEPIKMGFQEYETQIGAIQTILSNTRSKGSTLEDVNNALDDLNKYADKTIYNFTQMTKNIGTFTAAGVDLNTATQAIKGIANLAAVSGSTSQQASTAMYQLSQALAAGRVSLMDWNSVVNAGMGGEVFQNALKRTARNMGTGVDEAIKKYGTFRESLTQGKWLTTEVLTETLNQLAGAYSKEELLAKGYTDAQAKEIMDLAADAVSAATDVKTFSQLVDTTKEAMQSGWTNTWELIIGDFEEAKKLYSDISRVLNDVINEAADARNNLLKGWKDLGGRTLLLESFKNIIKAIGDIIAPVSKAFRNVFPPATSQQIYDITKAFHSFSEKLLGVKEYSSQIEKIFTGVFSVIKTFANIVWTITNGIGQALNSLFGLTGGILDFGAACGEYITKVMGMINKSTLLEKIINSVTKAIDLFIQGVVFIGEAIKKTIGSEPFDLLFNLLNRLVEVFNNINFNNLSGAIGAGGLGAIIMKMFKGTDEIFSIKDGIIDVLNTVKDSLTTFQDSVKAETLFKIGKAVALLTASLYVLSTIDTESLVRGLFGLATIFVGLTKSLTVFNGLSKQIGSFRDLSKGISAMIGIATAMVILASALKIISSIDSEKFIPSLVSLGVMMGELSMFLNGTKSNVSVGTALGLVVFASSLMIMSKAVKMFGELDPGVAVRGLTALSAVLAGLYLFMKGTASPLSKGGAGNLVTGAVAISILSGALIILSKALQEMGSMNGEQIATGLIAMGSSITIFVVALKQLNGVSLGSAAGLSLVTVTMPLLATTLEKVGSLSWGTIFKGVTAMTLSLAMMTKALTLISSSGGRAISAGAGIIAMATALTIMVPVMRGLGSLDLGTIGTALLAMAGTFTVIGVAGYALGGVVPVIFGLAAAIALLGVSVFAVGAGLAAFSAGLISLYTTFTVGSTEFLAMMNMVIMSFINLIPSIAKAIAEGVVLIIQALTESVSTITQSLFKMISETLKASVQYVPQIVGDLLTLFIKIIDTLTERIPELVQSISKFVKALFTEFSKCFEGANFGELIKGGILVGLMTGLVYGLSLVGPLIGPAMLGLLGVGALIAEMAIVLAAIGALNQIDGLQWLVDEGGSLLESIGVAIGRFFGGIIGGVAKGATSVLPSMGEDLSDFMTNLKPFIDGAKELDESVLSSITSLSKAILVLTAADFLDGITSFITGSSDMSDFADKLEPLGKGITAFSDSITDIKPENVEAASKCMSSLSELVSYLPKEGGVVGWFTGDTMSLETFGENLTSFGEGLTSYSASVAELKVENILSSVEAAKPLVDLANSLPESSPFWGLFGGEKETLANFAENIKSFGSGLAEFSACDIKAENVTASATAAGMLVDLANKMPESAPFWGLFGGEKTSLSNLGSNLLSLGTALKLYSIAISSIGNFEQIDKSITTFKSLASSLNQIARIDYESISAFKNAIDVLAGIDINKFVSTWSNVNSEAVVSVGRTLVNSLTAGVNQNASNVGDAIIKLINESLGRVQNEYMRFKTAGDTMAYKIELGIKSNKETILEYASTLCSELVSKFKTYYNDFYNAGKYLVEGLDSGIRNSSYKAYSAAHAVGKSSVNGLHNALDEHSPSRIAYKAGEYFGEPFVNAVASYSDKALKAGSKIGSSAKTGLSEAISGASDYVNGYMNLNPTIRPVVDLTNVKSGVGDINGMFNNNRYINAMSNVKTISASMNNKIQNGQNDDVIMAINKLSKDISGMQNSTYNINGITYDDGSNISDAIKTLVRAAKVERRA